MLRQFPERQVLMFFEKERGTKFLEASVFFLLQKKKKRKKFPENLENVLLFLCSISVMMFFFALRIFFFFFNFTKSGNILLNKMFYTDKGIFFS
jgi:hypothetical protein